MVSPRKTQQTNTHLSPQPTFSGVSKRPDVSRGYCFFIDLKDNDTVQTLKKRIDDLGLRRERWLTERVTHVISDGLPAWGGRGVIAEQGSLGAGRRRADAMLECLTLPPQPTHVTLSLQKAVFLLDKIYDSLFKVLPPINVKILKAPFIKFEPFDRLSRPVYKELEVWPEIPTEPEPVRRQGPAGAADATPQPLTLTPGDRMTRKHRTRKEETKETKGGYCEMCNADYVDAMVHRRSPKHLAFVRDPNNFRSLDVLIQSGTDVSAFLDKTAPVNGERRSLRKLCNGDAEHLHSKQTTNGAHSPRVNGQYSETKKRASRCRKSSGEPLRTSDDRQYYKVVGVSTKLRSSGAFAVPRRDSPPPTYNGASPGLVVKFRKVRRSELSVLSDEAEQFMFPRRASSSSSNSEEEDPPPPPSSERRRLARPTALKEDSSEDDSSEDQRRRRKCGPSKKSRLAISPAPLKVELPPSPVVAEIETVECPTPQEEKKEKCLKWEDGRLKAAPMVEELQFAFESVPKSEPWYETFNRQDHDKPIAKNVPQYFALYASSPKLPFEMGQLPPLKPNCCPLSDLVKKDEKPGPSRSYGTRGNKKQRIRKRTAAALIALEKHPRKSPREHASTLAILGGLLHRRKHQDDTKSTASEDTCSEANSNIKFEPPPLSQTREQSERLQQFLSEVFEDAAEFEIPEETMEGEATVATSTVPDVIHLVSECENCDIIRDEVREGATARAPGPARRGHKFKKKNRTGWPNKKKACPLRVGSADSLKADSASGDAHDSQEGGTAETTHDSASELDESTMASNDDASEEKVSSRWEGEAWRSEGRGTWTETDGSAEDGGSETRWGAAALQPVVRVTKMDPAVGRTLRSATSNASGPRVSKARRARAYRFR